MVDKQLEEQIAESINKFQKIATETIEQNPSPGRHIYNDMLDAVGICRSVVSRIPDSENSIAYLGEVVRALKTARERYRYEAEDEGGYGVVTFHQVIAGLTALYQTLGGLEEELEIHEDKLKSQLLYMAGDPWERCFRAFAMNDYASCLGEAEKIILEKAAALRPQVLLFQLISLQRTWQHEMAEQLASTLMLPANYNEPWLSALIRLIVGSMHPDEVATLAENEEQRCQFDFYAGARLQTCGEESAATASFQKCAASDADCDERYLAVAQLHPENRAAIASIYQLTLRAERYQEGGDLAQASALSTHAYGLACKYLGEDDPVTRSLTLRLARLHKAYG